VFKMALVGPRPLFLLFFAAFSYFYVQAVRGTWAYHRLRRILPVGMLLRPSGLPNKRLKLPGAHK